MLGMVIRDDCGTLIKASTNITKCFSAFEAKMKAVKWATSLVVEEGWKNFVFSIDAHTVGEEVNSNALPKGWCTSEGITNTCNALINNKRSSNILANELAKAAPPIFLYLI